MAPQINYLLALASAVRVSGHVVLLQQRDCVWFLGWRRCRFCSRPANIHLSVFAAAYLGINEETKYLQNNAHVSWTSIRLTILRTACSSRETGPDTLTSFETADRKTTRIFPLTMRTFSYFLQNTGDAKSFIHQYYGQDTCLWQRTLQLARSSLPLF